MNAALESARPYRLTVDAYHRMGEHGIIPPEARVELIDGAIVEMAPIGPAHAGIVNQFGQCLQLACVAVAIVAVQNPIDIPHHSAPQPDLVLLRPRPDFYKRALPRPEDVLLAIEVSDSTLAFDRDVKLPLYARHGIPEAWLVDLSARRIARQTRPGHDGYGSVVVIDRLAPVPLPGLADRSVDLSDLFD